MASLSAVCTETSRSSATKTKPAIPKLTTYSSKRSMAAVDPDEVEPTNTASQPLQKRSYNVQTARETSATIQPASKKVKLSQTTIDLGQNPMKRCKDCRMEYNSSNPEDAKLHKRYHAEFTAGITIRKGVFKDLQVVARCGRIQGNTIKAKDSKEKYRPENEDVIVVVKRDQGYAAKSLAEKALTIAEKDLGAIATDKQKLWKHRSHSSGSALPSRQGHFQVFMYIHDGTCLGMCLVEPINSAQKVAPVSSAQDSAISTLENSTPAKLGISRIWVSREYRKLLIASQLLDAAQANTLYPTLVSQEEMAFSQPTTAGASLARKWFGKEHGWLVYDPDN